MIFNNISLKPYNTFGLDYKVDFLISVNSENEIVSFYKTREKSTRYPLIIGEGSNILFTGDFDGTIIHADIGGIKIETQDNENVLISAGAGVTWDQLVEWSVNKGLGGLENLSLIPGRVGAAPIQNIGAYGAEVKDTIVKVRTISTFDGSRRIFSNEECGFSYRNSVFKTTEKGRYLVTRVYFRLKLNPVFNLDYGHLKEEVTKIGNPTLRNVRNAVINIRRNKLPDPRVLGNAGSFFRNPVVSRSVAQILKKNFPEMPVYEDPSGENKLAAGWLIEQCGWKGRKIGDAGVYDKQALILINYGNATGKEIYDLSEEIRESVLKRFGIVLEREVEVIGTT
jgi:UDP-N-acetylmuramate dehydrogenase